MSDGVVLAADLWLPTGGGTHPTLLQRTAYDKSNSLNSVVLPGLEPLRAVEEGFAVVIQDVRGRYSSGGLHRTFESDRRDGVETVDWIRKQLFSDGAVCSYGLSHNGLTQLLLAAEQPNGLRAIAPAQSAADCHEIWLYQGGAFQLGFCLLWATRFLASAELTRRKQLGTASAVLEDAFSAFAADPWAAYLRTPLVDVAPLAELCPEYVDWLLHPERADFCAVFGLPATSPAPDLPALIWVDGTTSSFPEPCRPTNRFVNQRRQQASSGWSWAPGGTECSVPRLARSILGRLPLWPRLIHLAFCSTSSRPSSREARPRICPYGYSPWGPTGGVTKSVAASSGD